MLFTQMIPASVSYDIKFGVERHGDNLIVLKETFDCSSYALEGSLQWEVARFCHLNEKRPVYNHVEEWYHEQTTRALLNL